MTQKTTKRDSIISILTTKSKIINTTIMKKQAQTKVVSGEKLPTKSTMPEGVLGKTDVRVPFLSLGVAEKAPVDKSRQEKEGLKIIEGTLSLGIRYFDTVASYGANEKHLEKVLSPYKKEIFSTSKTGRQSCNSAWQDRKRSLKRLNNVGLIEIKIPTYGGVPRGLFLNIGEAMGYVLSLPGVHCCFVATESVEMLKSNIRVAQSF